MRLVTWNVRGLRDDCSAIVAALGDIDADVVLLQEAPRFPGSGILIDRIAGALRLRKLVGDRSSGGLAVLANQNWADHCVSAGFEMLPRRAKYLVLRHYPRGTAAARFVTSRGGHIVVASIHLGLDAAERRLHVDELLSMADRASCSVVIGGDLNEAPGGPSWDLLRHYVADATPGAGFTFPAAAPQRRIDAILTSRELTVGSGDVVTATRSVDAARLSHASDHLPLVVDLAD